MNIYVIYPSSEGQKKYRFNETHRKLKELYPDDYNIKYGDTSKVRNDDIDWADMFICHWSYIRNEKGFLFLKTIKSRGKYLIGDIDDYWQSIVFSKEYYMFQFGGQARNKAELNQIALMQRRGAKKNNKQIHKTFKARIKIFDMLSTTTDYLKSQLKLYHDNIVVIPNALSESDCNIGKHNESDRFRVLWGGGSSHFDDLKSIGGLYSYGVDNIDKFQMILAGYSNKVRTSDGKVQESKTGTIWRIFEAMVTDSFYKLPQEYVQHLLEIKKTKFYDEKNMYYVRKWSKPISRYLEMYADADVVIAPLTNTIFNKCKSELKIIEAGFAKKPIIVSNITPYSKIEHKYNGMVVNHFKSYSKKVNQGWGHALKYLHDNPNAMQDMANRLYELVSSEYKLENVTEKRHQVYEEIRL